MQDLRVFETFTVVNHVYGVPYGQKSSIQPNRKTGFHKIVKNNVSLMHISQIKAHM